jgi:hypothetical protein
MKKLLLLAIGVAVLREVAKYYEIASWDDLKKMVMPKLKEVMA